VKNSFSIYSRKKKKNGLSVSEQEYLKQILLAGDPQCHTLRHNLDISKRLDKRPATVTEMIRKLALKQMVSYTKGKGFSLTEMGKKEALSILRRCQLWELFLVKELHMGREEVRGSLERLQAIVCDKLMDRLFEYLNYPVFDLYGEKIPDNTY